MATGSHGSRGKTADIGYTLFVAKELIVMPLARQPQTECFCPAIRSPPADLNEDYNAFAPHFTSLASAGTRWGS